MFLIASRFPLVLVFSCGLMLTLSTNLVLWMNAVTEESVHQTIFPEHPSNGTKHSGRQQFIDKGNQGRKCHHNMLEYT